MPQVTVIPSDTIIIVDGEVIHCPFEAPATLHAIQWQGDKGHIEYTDGTINKPLSGDADYLVHVLPYVDLWEAEKKRLEAEQPTQEELLVMFTSIIQQYLDDFAKTRNYDGILSVCSYATSKNPKFSLEGQYAVEARDAVWDFGYSLVNEVLSGNRPIPTVEELLDILPKLEWPEYEQD